MVEVTDRGIHEKGAEIVDSVDSRIKATVLDYTNSNPLAVRLSDTNGDYIAASTSGLALESGGNLDIISGDTTSIDGKITACNTGAVVISSGAVTVTGNVAHDSGDSGNPVKIGGRADTTFQAAVSNGDRVDALFDVYGQIRTRVDNANPWSFHEDSSNALTDQAVQGAPGLGYSVYITDIVFSTGAATACNLFIEEGVTTILGPYYLEAVAGRGCAIHFMTPKKCTANTAITATTSAAIAHSLDITGFIAP